MSTGSTATGDARRYARLPDEFPMRCGATLTGASVAYETWGGLNAAADNALLLFTGLSPSAHAASSGDDISEGWWEAVIGPGKAIDTDHYFVICVNSLGSCFGSTGPASIDPATGTAWRLCFPALAIEDITRAAEVVIASLGIRRLAAVAGPSLGGMAALAFVALFPGRARRLISISGTDAASPMAIALRSVQREAILRDPEWRDGNYAPQHPPRNGLRLARKLGTITYRSAREWNQRFARRRQQDPLAPGGGAFAPEFAIEAYLEVQAERFADLFDANCYLYLSRAMDRFELAEHAASGTIRDVFEAAGLEAALVIGVETDLLFPIAEQARIAAALEAAAVPVNFCRLDSREGHDAFLVDIDAIALPLRRFLAQA